MIVLKYESRIVVHLPDRVVEREWKKTAPEKAAILRPGIRDGIEFQVRTIRRTREVIPGFVTGEAT